MQQMKILLNYMIIKNRIKHIFRILLIKIKILIYKINKIIKKNNYQNYF